MRLLMGVVSVFHLLFLLQTSVYSSHRRSSKLFLRSSLVEAHQEDHLLPCY